MWFKRPKTFNLYSCKAPTHSLTDNRMYYNETCYIASSYALALTEKRV